MRLSGPLRHCLRLAMCSIALVMLVGGLNAQQSTTPRLADYVGTYANAPGHTLEIVDGDGLFAVVDEAKYPLRPSGPDQFITITGQMVPFVRDARQLSRLKPRLWPGPVPRDRILLRTIATTLLPTCMTESPSEIS
jgi:hypothetical protein